MGVSGFWSLVGLLLSGAVPGAFASLVQDGRMGAIEIKANLIGLGPCGLDWSCWPGFDLLSLE